MSIHPQIPLKPSELVTNDMLGDLIADLRCNPSDDFDPEREAQLAMVLPEICSELLARQRALPDHLRDTKTEFSAATLIRYAKLNLLQRPVTDLERFERQQLVKDMPLIAADLLMLRPSPYGMGRANQQSTRDGGSRLLPGWWILPFVGLGIALYAGLAWWLA